MKVINSSPGLGPAAEASGRSEFLDDWKQLANLFAKEARQPPASGTTKARLRIKEITRGRCDFVATGRGCTVSFANAEVQVGRIRIGFLSWTGDADCETTTWRAKDHHLSLHIPLTHAFEAKLGQEWKTIAPGYGLVQSGAGTIQRRWVGASDILNIMIDREALDQQTMLASPTPNVQGLLPKIAIIDLHNFSMFTNFLSLLLTERGTSTSLLKRPNVEYESARLLIQLLVASLQAAYDGQSARDRLAIVPGYIKVAERFMRDKFPGQISMRLVADACQISVRTLQFGFRRYRDTTPKEFIRSVRLSHARNLLVSNPSQSIASIANSVGYRSHSQFTGEYKKAFGESPKVTRGTRYATDRWPISGSAAGAMIGLAHSNV